MDEQQLQAEKIALSFEDTQVAFANKSDEELVKAYKLFKRFDNPFMLKVGKALTRMAFALHLPVKGWVKDTIFKQFCGGETLQECEASVDELAESGIKTVLEYSVEAQDSEEDYDNTAQAVLEAVDFAITNSYIKVISCKITGLGRFELLEKKHAGKPLSNQEQAEYERIHQRMDRISQKAAEAGVMIFYDAEESWIQGSLDELINDMMFRYNREAPIVFNAYQLYRTDRLEYLKSSAQHAKENGYIIGAKLVRGAYMEKERERAKEKGYPSPIHPDKQAVNVDYNSALDFCLENLDHVAVCAATHNEESCLYFAKSIVEKGLDKMHPHVFFSQLYGMGESLTYNLAKGGFEATKLIPYGPIKNVIPYLMRRAEENSSVGGQVSRELTLLEKEMRRRDLR